MHFGPMGRGEKCSLEDVALASGSADTLNCKLWLVLCPRLLQSPGFFALARRSALAVLSLRCGSRSVVSLPFPAGWLSFTRPPAWRCLPACCARVVWEFGHLPSMVPLSAPACIHCFGRLAGSACPSFLTLAAIILDRAARCSSKRRCMHFDTRGWGLVVGLVAGCW